mgnify:CR=1 FL=1
MAKKRAKQGFLPDMAPPSIKPIDYAADNYFEVMTERCKLSKEEDEKKTALIEVMKENRLDRYETHDGLVVTVTSKSGVKCKKKSEENGQVEE